MFALAPLIAWALALGSVTHVFAQGSCTDYTVQSGDDCTSIAAKFGITIAALEAANSDINSDCSNLFVGEVLCIPAAVAPPPPTCPSGVTFVVEAGDVCINIANMFNTTVAALELSNPQIDAACDNLAVGEVLCIPGTASSGSCPSGITFVVQSGDVCISIANMFDVTVAALELSNPQIDAACDNLFVGEVLCIPVGGVVSSTTVSATPPASSTTVSATPPVSSTTVSGTPPVSSTTASGTPPVSSTTASGTPPASSSTVASSPTPASSSTVATSTAAASSTTAPA